MTESMRRRQRRRLWMQAARVATAAVLLAGGALMVGALNAGVERLRADPSAPVSESGMPEEVRALQHELEDTRGRLALSEVKLQRVTAILSYSARYRIPADLAGAIYDIALTEGIQPAIGFQLVKVESSFRSDARSSKDAIGYTQLRLATARSYDPTVTARDLQDRDKNLRIGFRYLRDLLRRFDGDLSMALVAYNRGPTLVDSILVEGGDPGNGYAEAVRTGKPLVRPPVPPADTTAADRPPGGH